jgi:hypothetical protein
MSGCAVGPDGELLNANSIHWFNDADDVDPLPTSRPVRTRIPAAKLTEDNAERPALASHQEAIRAQQQRQKAKHHEPAPESGTLGINLSAAESTSLNDRSADLASERSPSVAPTEANSDDDDKSMKQPLKKSESCFYTESHSIHTHLPPVPGKRPRISSPSDAVDEDGFFEDVEVTSIDDHQPSNPKQKDRTRDVDEFFASAHQVAEKKYRRCNICVRKGKTADLVADVSTLRRHLASYHHVSTKRIPPTHNGH